MEILKPFAVHEGFRYVTIAEKSKVPTEPKWTTENNYPANHPTIQNWKFNIGQVLGYGGAICIDIDKPELIEKYDVVFKDTLIGQTGAGHRHYYGICHDKFDQNYYVFKNKAGELRVSGSQILMPGSIHPKGGTYTLINSNPIKEYTKDELLTILKDLLVSETPIQSEKIEVDYDFINKKILPKLTDETRRLIISANTPTGERSERDEKVIVQLLLKGCGAYIESIFKLYPVGDKYREHSAPSKYLEASIKSARKYSGVMNDDIILLENEISNLPDIVLKNKIDEYLLKISKIKDEMSYRPLLGEIAAKVKIPVKDLQTRIKKLKSSSDERIVHDWSEVEEKQISELEYWAEPTVPKNAIIYIGGSQGSGKSLITQIFLESFKRNNAVLGNFRIMDRPSILLYSLEMADSQLARRHKSFRNGNIFENNNLVEKDFKVVYDKFATLDLEHEIELAKDFDIIAIDSYRRILEGNENDSEITNKMFRDFIKPLRDLGKTVIIIFHFNKQLIEHYTPEEIMKAFRGSSDVGAEPDVAYGVFRYNEDRDRDKKLLSYDVSVLVGKVRDDYPIVPFKFNVMLDGINHKTTISGVQFGKVAIPGQVSPLQKRETGIIDLLNSRGEIEVHEITATIAAKFSCSVATIRRDLDNLLKSELIFRTVRGKYTTKKTEKNKIDGEEQD